MLNTKAIIGKSVTELLLWLIFIIIGLTALYFLINSLA